jgi:ankyrin repeat protein
VSLVCALVAPFVNDAELLREILGNAAALSTTNEKKGKDGDENLTALHVLTSRANINEDYLSEEKVLPLVELLVCEYKADALAQTRSGKTTPIHIAAARGCPKILKILYQSLDSFVAEDDAGTNEKKKKKRLFFMKDADEQTCLHLASRSGNREAVRAVLDILFDGDDDQFSRFSASVVHATDAWNRTGQDWAFLLGFHDALEVFSTFSLSASSSSSRELGENERDVLLPLLPVERDLISLPSKSSSSSEPSSSNTRKMDVSSEYLETLFTHLKKKNDKNTIENRLRAASGLRDSLCANARNRQLAFERNVATVLIETLVSLVSEEPTNKRMEEETLLLHVIFCIRNAAGYGPARKQFLTELDALPALASVVNGRRKEKHPREEVEGRESEEDNISWQALSAMIVLCRAKETKEGLLASMEMLKELGYEDVCGPIFERTNMKILKTAALSAAAAKRETR